MSHMMITSRLDNDYYAFTMGQLIWRNFPDVQVTYELTNRTAGIELGRLVKAQELKAAIEHVRQLGFSSGQLEFLRTTCNLDPEYVDWLRESTLPPVDVWAWNGRLHVTYTGDWASAIYWETPLLAMINQLANEARTDGHDAQILTAAERRLEAKIDRLAAHPRIHFMEFGTRRRYNAAWQHQVVARLQERIPNQLLGTSNVELAYRLGLAPTGTMAHQLFMVTTALARAAGSEHPIADSQREVLNLFEAEFAHVNNGRLLVFLPDTYGTATGLSLFEPDRARRWAGLRQDSGDPAAEVATMAAFYRELGIDPATKVIAPSDGLTDESMIALDAEFGGDSRLSFGPGTFLSNDTPIPPVSIVIKPVLANGHHCAKLSNNRAKAIGDPATIELLETEANFHASYNVQPVV